MSGSVQSFDAGAVEARALSQAEDLMGRGLHSGAQHAEAVVSIGETIDVGFESGDLKMTTVDNGSTLGLRVFRDHRMGFGSTNQAGASSLAGTARDAVALAGFSPADKANVLPGASSRVARPLVSESLSRLSIEEVVDLAADLLRAVNEVDPRLATDKASLSLHRGASAVVSSAGIRAAESDAAISLSLFGMAIDGDDVGGFDYWGDFVREVGDLRAVQAAAIERYASSALGNLGAGAAESYCGPVLFSPAAFQDVFLSPLVAGASAIAVQRGRSAMAGRVGQVVASECLSLVDDPTDSRLGGATSFDREGIGAEPFDILKDGELCGLLYNGYAAQIDGVCSTGHASGGPRTVPGLGAHALRASGGHGGDASAMKAQLGRGLLVQRFSGSVDPASGDFSGVAKSARWVEDGQEVRSVRETLFSGNAFDLLTKVLALSSQPEVVMGACRAPWALVDGVSVVAG